jgi:hypothetical protein
MDQAPNQPSPDRAGAIAAPAAVSPATSTWDEYYKAARRRRRALGGGRHLREEKRRRRFRERLGIAVSAVVVGAMTLVFYMMLR